MTHVALIPNCFVNSDSLAYAVAACGADILAAALWIAGTANACNLAASASDGGVASTAVLSRVLASVVATLGCKPLFSKKMAGNI